MIVSVGSDGEYNGVYYLIDRKAITADNYSAYKTALSAGEDVSSYFSMWMKLGTLADLATIENKLRELIGKIPEGKTIADMIAEIKPSTNLRPVDGTIVVADSEDGDKTIGVAIAPMIGNALTVVEGGLFVPSATITAVDDTHGLVAVNGVLTLNLATKDHDGAMSKEDKAFIDSIPLELTSIHRSIDALENICTWGDI